MLTALNDQLGATQGRIRPTNHVVSATDEPGPAVLTTLGTEPFELEDGEELLVSVDGGATQTWTVDDIDFADVSAATAAEVAAVLGAALSGASAAAVGGAVVLTTASTGTAASLQIVGGTANNALRFPTSAQGTQGEWSFVFGSDVEDRVVRLAGGDRVDLTQSLDFTGLKSVRITGAARPGTSPPSGYAWVLTVEVDGIGSVSRDLTDLGDDGFETFLLDDFGGSVDGLTTETLRIALELTGPATPVDVELPGVWLDFVAVEAEGTTFVIDRVPAPSQTDVPEDLPTLALTIAPSDGTSVLAADVQVYVDGVLAHDGASGFVAPFDGGASTFDGAAGIQGSDSRVTIDLSGFTPTSEQSVPIRVVADTSGGGEAIDVTYSIEFADVSEPQLTSAQARDDRTIRLSFNESMLMDSSAAGALNPASYAVTIESSPAYVPEVEAVQQVTTQVVDITLDDALTYGATYRVTAGAAIEDDDGNPIDSAVSSVTFEAWSPTWPDGRRFQVWEWWPPLNRHEDEGRELRRLSLILQDWLDQLLYGVDSWIDILDPDLADERYVDAMLLDLGNPFSFRALTLVQKRELAQLLVPIYKKKGTAQGLIDAVLLFTGVQVEVEVPHHEDFWEMGSSLLGSETFAAPAQGSPVYYSFRIVSPIILTEDQRSKILEIARYMKCAHEHILALVEPGLDPPPPAFWELGVSELGFDTIVQ